MNERTPTYTPDGLYPKVPLWLGVVIFGWLALSGCVGGSEIKTVDVGGRQIGVAEVSGGGGIRNSIADYMETHGLPEDEVSLIWESRDGDMMAYFEDGCAVEMSSEVGLLEFFNEGSVQVGRSADIDPLWHADPASGEGGDAPSIRWFIQGFPDNLDHSTHDVYKLVWVTEQTGAIVGFYNGEYKGRDWGAYDPMTGVDLHMQEVMDVLSQPANKSIRQLLAEADLGGN